MLYSLPKPQQAAAKAFRHVEAALLSELPSNQSALPPLSDLVTADTGMQRLTVGFLLLLGRMADNYQLEKAAFLKQLSESHEGSGLHVRGEEAAPNSPESPAATQTSKRPRTGASPSSPQLTAVEDQASLQLCSSSFRCMLAYRLQKQ